MLNFGILFRVIDVETKQGGASGDTQGMAPGFLSFSPIAYLPSIFNINYPAGEDHLSGIDRSTEKACDGPHGVARDLFF
jgi:hypothetical protein